jgi:hypothetical protein
MAASNYLEQKVLNLFRNVGVPGLPAVYVALHTADPTGDGSAATEVQTTASPSYARVAAQPGASFWTEPAPESGGGGGFEIVNTEYVLFPAHDGGASITVTHASLWDAADGGNMLWSAPLDEQETIKPGDGVILREGALLLRARGV